MSFPRSTKSRKPEEALFDVKETAKILGLTVSGLRSRIKKGTLGVEPVRIVSEIRKGKFASTGVMLRFRLADVTKMKKKLAKDVTQ
jgi:hypothetical protein